MKRLIFLSLVLSIFFSSCDFKKEELYKIETAYGDMIFKLYDATPLHKANFKKLIEQGYYDDLLFHRVIDGFMIQAGDPNSRNAKAGEFLGEGGPGYTIPAEFVDSIFHKKGVLAAARQGDATNPEKRSSGSQFYVVQGKVFNDEDIKKVENRINASRLNKLVKKYIDQAKNKAFETGSIVDYETILPEARKQAKEEFNKEGLFKIPAERKKVYKTIGGTPHLDDAYTVFGEVVKGLEVLDKIAAVQTDKNNRPLNDVKFRIKKL